MTLLFIDNTSQKLFPQIEGLGMWDLVFDLPRLGKVKFNITAGLSTCDFLLIPSSNHNVYLALFNLIALGQIFSYLS